jgi:hypothetical protein
MSLTPNFDVSQIADVRDIPFTANGEVITGRRILFACDTNGKDYFYARNADSSAALSVDVAEELSDEDLANLAAQHFSAVR